MVKTLAERNGQHHPSLPKEIPMKRLFACTVALALFAAVPAVAARGDSHQGNKRDAATQSTASHSVSGATHQNTRGGAMTGAAHTRTGGTNPQGTMSGNSFSAGVATGGTHTRTRGVNPQGVMSGNRSSAGTSFNTNSGRNSMRRDNSAPNNTVFGNTAGRHPTINSLRRNVQSSRHFHHGDYRAPQGYQYRHWTYGNRLPRSYFVRDYWITDFLMFGLFEPPPDLIWVRVGNDALLVDRYSGDIVQVDYDVFY
jgi:Ni/Co efflux regulator RcnB